MLVKAAIPITSGFEDTTTTYTNAGKVRNKGVEMSLRSINLDGRNGGLRWETTVTATFNRNRIISLNSDTPLYQNEINGAYVTMQRNDSPINVFYGYVTDGLFQTQEEVDNHAFQESGTAPGDIRFKDLNNDGVINDEDRTIIGDPNPDWMFSMVNDFSWKGFDLSIYLQGVTGNEIFNATNITTEGMSSAHNQTASVRYRWVGYGTSTVMPRAVYGDPNHNARISDRFVEDGSYLRLKNITPRIHPPRPLDETTAHPERPDLLLVRKPRHADQIHRIRPRNRNQRYRQRNLSGLPHLQPGCQLQLLNRREP